MSVLISRTLSRVGPRLQPFLQASPVSSRKFSLSHGSPLGTKLANNLPTISTVKPKYNFRNTTNITGDRSYLGYLAAAIIACIASCLFGIKAAKAETPDVWSDYNESVQELHKLEEFYNLWQSSNHKIETIWTSFRLLPLQPAYLIAAHYTNDQFSWPFRTKWSTFTQFDKAIQNREDSNKISFAITSALDTQRKIVALEKVVASFKDSTKTLQDKVSVYRDLKKEDAKLHQDILHKIWVAKGKPNNKNVAEVEMSQQPDGPYSKGVVEKMLHVYKEGYKMGDHFFENLLKEKK